MSEILILCCTSSVVSCIASAAAWYGGAVPNTVPHALKILQFDRLKPLNDAKGQKAKKMTPDSQECKAAVQWANDYVDGKFEPYKPQFMGPWSMVINDTDFSSMTLEELRDKHFGWTDEKRWTVGLKKGGGFKKSRDSDFFFSRRLFKCNNMEEIPPIVTRETEVD